MTAPQRHTCVSVHLPPPPMLLFLPLDVTLLYLVKWNMIFYVTVKWSELAVPLRRVFPPSQNSGIEKAFLFDVVSKIYIATDSTPVDMQTYELCCDMIDVVIDISCIYG